MQAGESRRPILWPLLLTAVGVLLLLDNFLLLETVNIVAYWPLLLVAVGVLVLLRGDFLPDVRTRSFGITRGSVESATLEVSSAEIDIAVRELQREERLIAGQYAADARPALDVQDTHAHLRLFRGATSWLSFADWDMGLARDLPWQLLVSTNLGNVTLNLSHLIVEGGIIATGLGDIRVVCPQEVLGSLRIQSAVGNIAFNTPPGYNARIIVSGPRPFGIHVDERRYEEVAPRVFESRDADDDAPLVEVAIFGTLGDAYLT